MISGRGAAASRARSGSLSATASITGLIAFFNRVIRDAAPGSIERIDSASRYRFWIAALSVVRVNRMLTRDCAHCSVTALTVTAQDAARSVACSTCVDAGLHATSSAATTTNPMSRNTLQ
jgi:hypothetical protein